MVKTRVDKLIDLLLWTNNSLNWACKDLGFEVTDLTDEELETLYDSIFQCEYCGEWTDVAYEEFHYEYGQVCETCASQLEEEED